MLPATKWHSILLMATFGVKHDSSLIVVSGHVEATEGRA